MQVPVFQSKRIIELSRHLLESYSHWKNKNLVELGSGWEQAAEALFLAPFAVLSHDGEADPILNYGNQVSLDLWGMTWDSFINTPSRLTAEPIHRSEREDLLQQVAKSGYIDNYEGVRIASNGRRFRIKNACLWNVLDDLGVVMGQAAAFDQWMFLD